MENKTVEELNKKPWYRLIKVLYIFVFICICAGILILTMSAHHPLFLVYDRLFSAWIWIPDILASISIMVIGIAATILIFELVKRIFYYISIGKFIPENDYSKTKSLLIKRLIIILSLAALSTIILLVAYAIARETDKKSEAISSPQPITYPSLGKHKSSLLSPDGL